MDRRAISSIDMEFYMGVVLEPPVTAPTWRPFLGLIPEILTLSAQDLGCYIQ